MLRKIMKIDGKEIANRIFEQLKAKVNKLEKRKITPHLTIILVGEDPASQAYVNQKKIKGKIIGVKITVKHTSFNIGESALLKTIEQLNNDNNVHGIIVQRPLPKTINSNKISMAIDPKKDVDGFNKESEFQTPIAAAVLQILKEIYSSSEVDDSTESRSSRFVPLSGTLSNNKNKPTFLGWLKSKYIVVIGKGETGGRPIIQLFKQIEIEPTVIDSKTKSPETITKKADIIISAVGKPNVIKPEIIKKGVILISVGLHKGEDGKLYGDYEEEKIKNIASFYTPTPGGAGPVNVAMLLKNLIDATENY